MSQLLAVEDLRKAYKTGDGGTLEVLRGMSFSVEKGQVVAVVGESGAGKSTLLHLLGALDRPSSGTVYFGGEDIYQKDDEALARFRNRSIGFVFQFHHLLPEFTALENVAMPALIQNKPLDEVQDRAANLLELLGLKERVSHRPGQMSGGEKQRVAVARALMNEPGLVLADEPTGNLDVKTAESLHHELIRLSRTFQQSFVIVTHNPAFAKMADRVLTIEQGLLKEYA
ncbi:MAG: ABC transporter ATP-binding protein [Bacteroidota bacterium]